MASAKGQDQAGTFSGTVCIVGAGHAAHAFMALLPSRGIRTVVYAGFSDEADRLNKCLGDSGSITANFAPQLTPSGEVKGRPVKISKNPEDVIPEADVILMPVPSFAFAPSLRAVAPFIKAGTLIGATPGQGGFDYIARKELGSKAKTVVFFAQQCMPFNCRIATFGERVEVQQFEKWYNVFSTPVSEIGRCVDLTRAMYDTGAGVTVTPRGSFWGATLAPLNANIHPQRMYSMWKDYKEGMVYDRNPFFYEECPPYAGELMHKTSDEILAIAKALKEVSGEDVYSIHIYDSEYASFADPTAKTVDELFSRSPAYKGFKSPMVAVEGGFKPDFKNRYFTEDVPFSLCVWRGVAELLGVPTPTIDLLLRWAQGHMGKEYLTADGKLAGPHVGESSAPQAFGITSAAHLVHGME